MKNWSNRAFLVLTSVLPLLGPPWSSRSKEHRPNHLALDQISRELPIGTSQCGLRERGTINTGGIRLLTSLLSSRQSKTKKGDPVSKVQIQFRFCWTLHFPPQTLQSRMEAPLSQAKQRGRKTHTLSVSARLFYLLPLRLDPTTEIPPLFSTDRARDDLSFEVCL